MTLRRFLTGQSPAPRANGGASEGSLPSLLWTRRWSLQHRHAEGGAWTVVADAEREGTLRDEMPSKDDPFRIPSFPYTHGDLVVLRGASGVVRMVWVAGLGGFVDAGLVNRKIGTFGRDWVSAWEGPDAEADTLLTIAFRVDQRRLVRAACDFARLALPFVPAGNDSAARAIEAAQDWTLGNASDERLLAAQDVNEQMANLAVSDRAGETARRALVVADHAILAVLHRNNAPLGSAFHAEKAAAKVARVLSDTKTMEHLAALHHLAAMLRVHVPLSVLLLSGAGEPTPLGLGI